MDMNPPHLSGENKEPKENPKKKPAPQKEDKNSYQDMLDGYEDDINEDDPEGVDSLDDPGDDPGFEDEPSFLSTTLGKVVIGVGIVVILGAIYFFFIKEDPPPPEPITEEVEEAIDPTQALKSELYKKGIGKDQIDEKNIYEQGPIESSDFRKDFVNTDSPENYVLPIEIVAVNDSVSYTKHRTMTDDGMDMYWVDAMYKDKKTRFTVPYYIWQTLAPQGVMDVIAEVVTDAEGKTFVTSITAVPPNTEE